MNKLIIIILLVTLVSCGSKNTVTLTKEEYSKLKGDTIKPIPTKTFKVDDSEYRILLGSDGHEYYSMCIGSGGYHVSNRHFHYPDCIKCKKQTEELYNLTENNK